MRRRLRRILRKVSAAVRSDDVYPPSPTWPALPARRLLTSNDLAMAGNGHFVVVRDRLVIDHRAHITTEAMKLPTWLLKEALHTAKVAVPAFRDCTLVALVATAETRA